MKKICFLFLLVLGILSCRDDKPVVPLPEYIVIESNEDLAMYCDQLRELEVFEGDIALALYNYPDFDLSLLDCFKNLKEIRGETTISGLKSNDLDFLSNIEYFGHLVVLGCNNLDTLTFPKLKTVNGVIQVFNNENLVYFKLPNIENINQTVSLVNNLKLKGFEGSSKIETLNGINIEDSQYFDQLVNFPNVTQLYGNYRFLFNEIETSNVFLKELNSEGSISILSRLPQNSFSFLKNLKSSNSLQIFGNLELDSLCVFSDYAKEENNIINCNNWLGGTYIGSDILEHCD